MKRMYKNIALVISVIMLAGCGGKDGQPGGQQGMGMGMGSGTASTKTSVEIENPKVETIKDEYKYTGTMVANDEVDVTSKVSGKVTAVNYDVGDYVEKGAVLFTIDTTDIQNSINSTKASLKTSDASIASAKTNLELANGSSTQTSLANAKNQITNAEKQIETAKNSLETAKQSYENTLTALDNQKITLDKAQSDYDTNKELYDVGGVSKEALDNYENALSQAKNSYTQQENAVKTAQTNVENAQLSVEQAEESLAQAQENYEILQQTPEENIRKAEDSLNSAIASRATVEAQLKANQSSLNDYTVLSPISGYITAKNVTEGAMFSGVAYTVSDTSTVDIEVNVSEEIETKVKVGDEVRIIVPSISDENIVGSITQINPGANTDGTYTIKVKMQNADGKYKTGLYSEVYFAKEASENALTLTRNSVLHSDDEYSVFVEKNGVVEKRIVTVGIDTGERIEVTSGISADDRIVSKGQTYLKDGDEVKVVAENGVDVTGTLSAGENNASGESNAADEKTDSTDTGNPDMKNSDEKKSDMKNSDRKGNVPENKGAEK